MDPSDRPDDAIDRHVVAAAGSVLGGRSILTDALARWAVEARVDEAALARARQRWLAVQDDEGGSLVGVLVDLGERGTPVVIDCGTVQVSGQVAGVGTDFVALAPEHRGRASAVLVRLEVVSSLRAEPGARPVAGGRPAAVPAGLAQVLGPIAADRPEVLVRPAAGGPPVRGRLLAAGRDVVRVRTDAGASVWVPIRAVAVLLLDV